MNSQARAGTGSRRGDTALGGMLTASTFHLHRSRRHSPSSRHTPGGGQGSHGSGTGTQSSGTLRGGLQRMTFHFYSLLPTTLNIPPAARMESRHLHPGQGKDVRAGGTCWLSRLLRPRGSKQPAPLEAPSPQWASPRLHPASSLPSSQSLCPSQRHMPGTHWSPPAQDHCLGPQRSSSGSQS